MMKVLLKRIRYASYDDFVDKVLENATNLSSDFFTSLSEMCEEVVIYGKDYEVEIDAEGMASIIDNVISSNFTNPMQKIDIKLSKVLFECFSLNTDIPKNVFFEKEVWAFLNCYVLFEVVRKRYFNQQGDFEKLDRVKRVLLSDCSVVDRTGLRWLWSLAEATYEEEYLFSLTETAFRFIDPVKALYERELGLNRVLFKSFIRAIQLLDYDPRIRSNKYRSVLLTHLRNLASLKMYESFDDINNLAKVFAEDIKYYLGDKTEEELEFNDEYDEED